MNADEKLCPFCAEIIKAKAIKCRHCLADFNEEYKFSATSKVAESRIPHKIEQTRNYIWWILFGLIVVILAFTNPNEKDFKYEIVKKIQESEKVDDSNPFHKLMLGVASYAIESVTERNNYLIFSIFEIDSSLLKIVNPDMPRLRFLGIGRQIIPLFNMLKHADEESSARRFTEPRKNKSASEEPSSNPKKLKDSFSADIPESIKAHLQKEYSDVNPSDFGIRETLDINGDHTKDYVITIDKSEYCGVSNTGCLHLIFISNDRSHYRLHYMDNPRWIELSKETIDGLPILNFHVLGTMCDGAQNNAEDCIQKLYWHDQKLEASYHLNN